MKGSLIFVVMSLFLVSCSLLDKNNKKAPINYTEPGKTTLKRSTKEQAKTLTDLAISYYQLGKYVYALEYLNKSLALDINNAITYQTLALINQRSNKPAQAQLYFDQALLIEPENYDIRTNYATFLYQQGVRDKALTEFKKVIGAPFYNKKWVAYTFIGLYDLKNNQEREAEKHFYYALKINPSYAPALIEMARIRYHKAEMMSARAYVERYFSQVGKTLEGLQLGIKIERALQSHEMLEIYERELKREFPFAE